MYPIYELDLPPNSSGATKSLERDLKKQISFELTKKIRLRQKTLFRTIRELPGIGKKPRTRDDLRLQRNLPLSFMIVRQKPTQTFIF